LVPHGDVAALRFAPLIHFRFNGAGAAKVDRAALNFVKGLVFNPSYFVIRSDGVCELNREMARMVVDLPLNFHPRAIRASAGFTPWGAGGATCDRRSWSASQALQFNGHETGDGELILKHAGKLRRRGVQDDRCALRSGKPRVLAQSQSAETPGVRDCWMV
jgi:hypothetical protein